MTRKLGSGDKTGRLEEVWKEKNGLSKEKLLVKNSCGTLVDRETSFLFEYKKKGENHKTAAVELPQQPAEQLTEWKGRF
ncbi:hypothetical protein FF1_027026 [Malus domestica]